MRVIHKLDESHMDKRFCTMRIENFRFTTPIQQLHNNLSHEGESHTLGPTLT
jgi:hypothetical protein